MLRFILRVNGCKAKCMKTSPGIKMCTWAARLRLSDHFEDWTSLQDRQMFSSQRSRRGRPSSKWPESSVSSQKCSELQVKFIISIQLVWEQIFWKNSQSWQQREYFWKNILYRRIFKIFRQPAVAPCASSSSPRADTPRQHLIPAAILLLFLLSLFYCFCCCCFDCSNCWHCFG